MDAVYESFEIPTSEGPQTVWERQAWFFSGVPFRNRSFCWDEPLSASVESWRQCLGQGSRIDDAVWPCSNVVRRFRSRYSMHDDYESMGRGWKSGVKHCAQSGRYMVNIGYNSEDGLVQGLSSVYAIMVHIVAKECAEEAVEAAAKEAEEHIANADLPGRGRIETSSEVLTDCEPMKASSDDATSQTKPQALPTDSHLTNTEDVSVSNSSDSQPLSEGYSDVEDPQESFTQGIMSMIVCSQEVRSLFDHLEKEGIDRGPRFTGRLEKKHALRIRTIAWSLCFHCVTSCAAAAGTFDLAHCFRSTFADLCHVAEALTHGNIDYAVISDDIECSRVSWNLIAGCNLCRSDSLVMDAVALLVGSGILGIDMDLAHHTRELGFLGRFGNRKEKGFGQSLVVFPADPWELKPEITVKELKTVLDCVSSGKLMIGPVVRWDDRRNKLCNATHSRDSIEVVANRRVADFFLNYPSAQKTAQRLRILPFVGSWLGRKSAMAEQLAEVDGEWSWRSLPIEPSWYHWLTTVSGEQCLWGAFFMVLAGVLSVVVDVGSFHFLLALMLTDSLKEEVAFFQWPNRFKDIFNSDGIPERSGLNIWDHWFMVLTLGLIEVVYEVDLDSRHVISLAVSGWWAFSLLTTWATIRYAKKSEIDWAISSMGLGLWEGTYRSWNLAVLGIENTESFRCGEGRQKMVSGVGLGPESDRDHRDLLHAEGPLRQMQMGPCGMYGRKLCP